MHRSVTGRNGGRINSQVWQEELRLMFRVSLNVEDGLISGKVDNVDCAVTIEIRMQTHETYCIYRTDLGCRYNSFDRLLA